MAIVYVIAVLTALLCFTYYYFTRTFNYWKKRKVAGPRPVPFFGNLKESALRRKHIGVVYKEIYDQFPDEKVVGIYRMTSPVLLVRDLDMIKYILIKDFEVFSERGIRFSKEKLGDNLFHCDVYTWGALKHRMTSLFTPSKLKYMFQTTTAYADRFIVYMENICHTQSEQEMYQHFQKYTISTIISLLFGLDVDTFNDKSGAFDEMHKSIFTLSKYVELDMMYPGILERKNISLFSDKVQQFCKEIIKNVTKQRNGTPSGRNDAMDLLIALKNKNIMQSNKLHSDEKIESFEFTDDVMAGQVFILFIAGYATSAMTLSNTMYQLAKNLIMQNKMVEEIGEVLQKYEGRFTYDAFKEMTCLSEAFDETLRFYPLINGIQRIAKKNYKLPDTEMTIEKGTSIIMSPYAIHHDEKYYPDPDVYNPHRFSTENSKSRHSCSYLTFGGGPRSCLGMQLAKMEIGVMLAKFVLKFRVEPSANNQHIDKYNPHYLLMFSEGGVNVNIISRK